MKNMAHALRQRRLPPEELLHTDLVFQSLGDFNPASTGEAIRRVVGNWAPDDLGVLVPCYNARALYQLC